MENVLWALAVALAVALLVTAGTWPIAVRRRREHAALVRDAVARMCAQDRPTRLCRLARDVVEVLVRQDQGAEVLGRTPDADVDRLVNRAEDAALLVSAEAVSAPHPLGRKQKRPDDSTWQVAGKVPRVADHDELTDLCARMRGTARRRIARARLVLAQAERVTEDEQCRERLRVAFEHADEQVRAAGDLADAGDVLAALRALTRVELPVPEDGVPGQADTPDLRAQVNALARLALRHLAAVAAHRGGRLVTGAEEGS
ncbi:hypothetical protein [Saccharothrix variisporea]|uniref:Uncharacterized protein n=1 Tax=Saccharothrix variisporea TaxID=543527 RepID=A0A495XDI8_9PSEU|nr:hypothetical protein [Saccharothrix variisporea]RKT70894.1 hypothetical protein DFJ66_4171 [Saccharothrix variisporea]